MDWLEGGHTLDDFLDNFPSVRREQAIASLTYAAEAVGTRLEDLRPLGDALRDAVARVTPGAVVHVRKPD